MAGRTPSFAHKLAGELRNPVMEKLKRAPRRPALTPMQFPVATVGSSVSARKRLRRASLLSRAFSAGDKRAAKRLFFRGLAYRSLEVGMPWQERLALANAAGNRNREECMKREQMERLCRPWHESTRDL